MKKMNDTELKDKINEVLKQNYPASLNELGRLLGYKKISGDMSARIKKVLPGIERLLKGNKVLKELTTPSTTPIPKNPLWKSPDKVNARKCKYARHQKNPYRDKQTGYALCFDILAAHKNGLRRDQLVELYAKESGKDIHKGAMWDTAVVVSPNEDGSKHRSAKDGYWCERGCGGFLKIHFR